MDKIDSLIDLLNVDEKFRASLDSAIKTRHEKINKLFGEIGLKQRILSRVEREYTFLRDLKNLLAEAE